MKQTFSLPLVNAHAHAAMVAFRGMAEDLPLKKWLYEHIFPAEKERVNPKFVYSQTKMAIKEMRANGISAFCDMYFFEREVARAAQELEMPAVIGETIMDFPTPGAKCSEDGLAMNEQLLEEYKKDPIVKVAVAAHSIYTVLPETLVKAKTLAKKYGAVFHLHLAETETEFKDCLLKNNCSPVAYADKLGLLDEKTLLAHCVCVSDEDIEILARRKANVAHCPLSNLKLGSGIAPIAKMIAAGVNVCIGTDGAASSNRLDVWEAGKLAVLMQKGITNDPAGIGAVDAVRMMTVNGLKALGCDRWGGKSLADMERELLGAGNYNYLYNLHANEIDFNL